MKRGNLLVLEGPGKSLALRSSLPTRLGDRGRETAGERERERAGERESAREQGESEKERAES